MIVITIKKSECIEVGYMFKRLELFCLFMSILNVIFPMFYAYSSCL